MGAMLGHTWIGQRGIWGSGSRRLWVIADSRRAGQLGQKFLVRQRKRKPLAILSRLTNSLHATRYGINLATASPLRIKTFLSENIRANTIMG